MTPRELEIAKLNADLAEQGRADQPTTAQILQFVPRIRQALQAAGRAQTEADHWAQRHRDGDDCA